jgi:hypothetical protein
MQFKKMVILAASGFILAACNVGSAGGGRQSQGANLTKVAIDQNGVPPIYIYPDDIGSYEVGTIVQGVDGKLYVCKEPDLCNNPTYRPGTFAWELATPAS